MLLLLLLLLLQAELGIERIDEAARPHEATRAALRSVLSDRPLKLSSERVLQAHRRSPSGASHAADDLPCFLDVQT